ncbi:hypothetical protein MMC07_002299 [Pseudocyphellaria aurata]|nr:hypothetical protein [Pseudocyphellaria aurata]
MPPRAAPAGPVIGGPSRQLREDDVSPRTTPKTPRKGGQRDDEPSGHAAVFMKPKSSSSSPKWTDVELRKLGLPVRWAHLTDSEVYKVIEGPMPAYYRNIMYPDDFVLKGFPRKDRIHKDPPALLQGPGHQIHYAVVCGIYQLHGEEGELLGLKAEKGNWTAKSVKTESSLGEKRGGDIPVHGPTASREEKEQKIAVDTIMSGDRGEGPTRFVFEDKDMPETDNEDATTPTGTGASGVLSEMTRYARQMDHLLNEALVLVKDVKSGAVKSEGKVGSTSARFNNLKKEWSALRASLDNDALELLKGPG